MPPLTLHVLPPAFSLPSVSSDDIAAVALLRYTQQYGTWIVVADAAEFPNRRPPFLTPAHHPSQLSPDPVEGLDAIIEHLSAAGQVTQLENNLTLSQRSEALALSSHLQLRLQPLVALSLFVCSENYTSLTRPSFAEVLPFPESWILPHRLYDQALEAAAHLGITAKDLSLLQKDTEKSKSKNLAHGGPFTDDDDAYGGLKSDDTVNPTVMATLKMQQRIDKWVLAALSPFASALGIPQPSSESEQTNDTGRNEPSKLIPAHWLFNSSSPTVADLTAISLLSLAALPYLTTASSTTSVQPSLAIPFLQVSIHKQFPGLVSGYLMPALEDAFAGQTSLQRALISAPLATSPSEEVEEDEGALDDAIQGYGNMDVGSGQVEIPWRRKRQGTGWESMQRLGNAVGALLPTSIGS